MQYDLTKSQVFWHNGFLDKEEGRRKASKPSLQFLIPLRMNKLGSALGGLAAMAAVGSAQAQPEATLVSSPTDNPEQVSPAVLEAQQALEASAGELTALNAAHGVMTKIQAVMEDDSLGLINLVEDSSLCYVLEDFEVGDECIAIAERIQLATLDLQIAQAESRNAELETDLAETQASVAEREATVAENERTIAEMKSDLSNISAEADTEAESANSEEARRDAEA